jgi:hypothetical protein
MSNRYPKSNPKETAKVKGLPPFPKRGLPGDLEAVRAMGFELEGSKGKGWRLKG